MTFTFDIISDLHVEPGEDFNWSGQQTSLYCLVIGDVSRDRETLIKTLRHIASCYLGTLYIDGNDEHRDYLADLDASYSELQQELQAIPGLIFLHNNVVVIDGIAFIGVNGWWCFNFDPALDFTNSIEWYCEYTNTTHSQALATAQRGYNDAAYLTASIQRLQKHPDVRSIVVVSHTVPAPFLTSHDIEMTSYYRYNCLGNQHLHTALTSDTANKVTTWCFGHYHNPIDREIADIRFVSNPRGRLNTPWCQKPYYAQRIELTTGTS